MFAVFVGAVAAVNLYFGYQGSGLNMLLGILLAIMFIVMLSENAGSSNKRGY